VRNLKGNLLFSTLIFGSVFSDYVVFYGDAFSSSQASRCRMIVLRPAWERRPTAAPLDTNPEFLRFLDLILNTQIRVASNNMGVFTDTPPLGAVLSLEWTVLFCD